MIYAGTFFGALLLLFFLSKTVSARLSLLFYRITKSQKATVNLMAFLFFPGTIIHELSHFFMAALLFVPTGHIDLWPKMEDNHSVKLGSVQIAQTDIFRRFLIGAAPFLFGVSLLLGLLFFFVTNNLFANHWFVVLMVYLAFEIGNTMFSSKKDMEGALELFGALLFFTLVLYFLGVRIPELDIPSFFNNPTVSEIFRQGSIFLSVPLGIDIIILLLLRIFSYRKLS
ncbi:MAG TPA: hypothetical protein VLF20_02855 [Patescibacteria group bacterium]|nr:hypothetical protein [Patescibacteria group bacterium]